MSGMDVRGFGNGLFIFSLFFHLLFYYSYYVQSVVIAQQQFEISNTVFTQPNFNEIMTLL